MDEIEDRRPRAEQPALNGPIVVGTIRHKGTALRSQQTAGSRCLSYQGREVRPASPRGDHLPADDYRRLIPDLLRGRLRHLSSLFLCFDDAILTSRKRMDFTDQFQATRVLDD